MSIVFQNFIIMCCTANAFSFIVVGLGQTLSICETPTLQIWDIFLIFKIIFLPHFLCHLYLELLLSDVGPPELSSNFLNVFSFFSPPLSFCFTFWRFSYFSNYSIEFFVSLTLKFNFKIFKCIFSFKFFTIIFILILWLLLSFHISLRI